MHTEPLAPVPETGHIFETSWRMGTADMDDNYHLRLDSTARYLQEAGVEHLDHTEMHDEHPHWIVRRTVVDVIRPIEWPEQVRLRRWCSGLSPRWCNMRVRIDGAKGGLIETEGFWIHMNKATMGPSRMSDDFFATMATTATDQRLRWRSWFSEPLDPDAAILEFPLRRTDVDHFQHVTNASYWHGIHEVADRFADLFAKPHRLVIEYAKPITYGENVQIHTVRSGDTVHIWFAVDGDVRSHAGVVVLPDPPREGTE
ncbi:acyl-[acyl-carrier-protein] thioesterase [Antrihabitans sp. YC2-6]|uniref:acyl-[acyl-carrier-protein] thioesterase n=1 Tax=Antrihabitans sp. YC2-6 TaxID=2799498 RepID=UPI0018F4A1F9|nr:acyl-ACP thioesterase domain-containing protein [Antrihabitans sp. YC2-6]MBJ8347721.1 hypothetical protein [Antrihabitans sp. YC2-6]